MPDNAGHRMSATPEAIATPPRATGLGRPAAHRAADLLLLAGFLLSGCSALIYQVGWQRALYAYLGVDIDSITIVVSVFMAGIGLGGMVGGWLADRQPSRRLHWYAAIELSIGLYGWVSLDWLPRLVGTFAAAAGGGAGPSAAASFVFLLLPTVLMGMTLPLLTMAFDERRANIGVSVGTLYFINTLGAAAGAALVPFFLLPQWPLSTVVRLAVAGNLAVIACTFLAALALRRGP